MATTKMYRVTVLVPSEKSTYVVGEAEKNFMVSVFGPLKDGHIIVEEIELENPESVWGVLFHE